MRIKYLKDAAGIKKGTERELRDSLAKPLIAKGIIEAVKEAKTEALETKEEKKATKRKTKSKK